MRIHELDLSPIGTYRAEFITSARADGGRYGEAFARTEIRAVTLLNVADDLHSPGGGQ